MPRRPAQAAFNNLYSSTARALSGHVDRLTRGDLDTQEWREKSHRTLEQKHARAAYLGRKRGGDFSDFNDADVEFGISVAADEAEFLADFAAEIEAGDYTDAEGNLDAERVKRRVSLYCFRLLGTANEAFTLTSEYDALFDWLLGAAERHCRDCPRLASNSPHRLDDLETMPGMNQTECMSGCNCRVKRRSDGIEGFRRPA